MKARIHQIGTHKYVVIGILLTLFILTLINPTVAFFTGFGIALITLWSSNWKWERFGMYKPNWGQTILGAFAYSIILYVLVNFAVTPLIELVFGQINYDHFEGLRGNLPSTLLFILVMWPIAAIGEEFLFRGYYLRQLAKTLGDTKGAWIAGVVYSSIVFGLAHQYQDTAGVIQTGIVGLAMSYLFYFNRKNLVLLMLVHGFYNTIGIILIYLNSERIIIDFILNK